MSDMQGLLDFLKSPEGVGVMSGLAGWAANARKGTPWNNVGKGAMTGLLGYSQAQDQQAQMAQQKQMEELRGFQMAQMRQQMSQQQKMQEAIANDPTVPDYVRNGYVSPSDYFKDKFGSQKLGYGEKIFRDGQVIADGGADPNKMSKSEELIQRHKDRMAEIAAAAALRPAPAEKMVTVMDADGNPFSVPQSQAIADKLPIYSAGAAKQLKDRATAGGARKQLSEAVSELRGYYDDLRAGGGVTSSQDGFASNALARLGSSAVGQFAGGVVGTKNQTTRQKIEQTRPLLLNLIKNATGMSAQQMNSNAEMKMYLQAATDPTLSYEANIQALDNLDKLFGHGLSEESPNGKKSSIGAGGWSATVVK